MHEVRRGVDFGQRRDVRTSRFTRTDFALQFLLAIVADSTGNEAFSHQMDAGTRS